MKKLLLWFTLLCWSQFALALAPYVQGAKLAGADLNDHLTHIESKLRAAGFIVIGRHTPQGLKDQASVVVTDPAMLEAIRDIGGSAVVAAGIRVGVQSDGTVSYMNPAYWYRAFLREQFPAVQEKTGSVQARLKKALGDGSGFGGDVPEADLPRYRYMFGMERFDSANSELSTHPSFEDAFRTVQDNLSKGVGSTRAVYQVVMPERKLAVFGVAMNASGDGEAWWVNKIGADHVAALPYEIFIVDNKVYALYARYRIALAWPSLGMGTFMTIVNAPEAIRNTLGKVAGGTRNN